MKSPRMSLFLTLLIIRIKFRADKMGLCMNYGRCKPQIGDVDSRMSNQRRWVDRSHLSILGADAHMVSTFIQTDLVDLHRALQRHNIKASFFFPFFFFQRGVNIVEAGQMLLADILTQLSEMPGKAKAKRYGMASWPHVCRCKKRK